MHVKNIKTFFLICWTLFSSLLLVNYFCLWCFRSLLHFSVYNLLSLKNHQATSLHILILIVTTLTLQKLIIYTCLYSKTLFFIHNCSCPTVMGNSLGHLYFPFSFLFLILKIFTSSIDICSFK